MHGIDVEINSDVLVIGGAGAAVMSAVNAAKTGADVVVVSKGKIGKSGNTIMIGGGFSIDGETARKEIGKEDANPAVTKEKLYEKLVTSSFYLGNQKIERQYVNAGGEAVKKCLKWAEESGQKFHFSPAGVSWTTSGRSFGRAVKAGIKEAPEIKVFEDILIVDILLSDNKACGAIGLNIYTGEVIKYKAKSVILATGGFQPFSLKNSISDMTGDGIAMALRAGARVTDMEFLLFIPTITEPAYAKGSILPYLLTIPAISPITPKVTDLDGKEIVIPEEFDSISKGNKIFKIIYSYFWGKKTFEKYEKYGNNFYYDFSDYTEEEIYGIFEKIAELEALWHPKGMYNGINLKELAHSIIINQKRLKVGLGNEYSMGGISVKEDFTTGVTGLYAAGEVTAGTFGAFRSGDGLVEMLAQGVAAGENAALYAKETTSLEADNTEEILNALFAPLEKQDGLNPAKALLKIEEIADEGFNFFRTGSRLGKASEDIASLSASLKDLSTASDSRKYNLDWYNSVIARNLTLCTQIGIYAANNRKESRGCHMRTDYPSVDNINYLYNTYASLNGGKLVYSNEKPEEVYTSLPVENVESIPEYILEQYGGKTVESISIKK